MKPVVSASVLARLLNLARQRDENYSLLLNRFGLERFLYRLSVSAHAHRFVLKGALLFAVWYDQPHRPTRDADLMGTGQEDTAHLSEVFRDIAAMDLQDGVVFDPGSVQARPIREDQIYGGTRLRLVGHVGPARCSLQIDVGFGDAVTPGPQGITFPVLLQGFTAPSLKAYPVYTVIAEKYHAMVTLGPTNSRMKDFYDLSTIAARDELDGATLARAIAATFGRRGTPLPAQLPLALTQGFCRLEGKPGQWSAFLAKNKLAAADLPAVVAQLQDLLWPASQVAISGSGATARWMPAQRAWV